MSGEDVRTHVVHKHAVHPHRLEAEIEARLSHLQVISVTDRKGHSRWGVLEPANRREDQSTRDSCRRICGRSVRLVL